MKNTLFASCQQVPEIEIESKDFALNQPVGFSANIDVENADLSYNDFFLKYMLPNRPCIIKNLAADWASTKLWITKDNKVNFTFLKEKYGNVMAPVADCNKKYYNSQEKSAMTVREFIEYWQEYSTCGYPADKPCLYLKDWHFAQCFPMEDAYEVPKFFASDWLNEYFVSNESLHDDYRFIYMGPKGSWTPFHEDVFSSYSWSVNVCGCKRWALFKPGEEILFKDKLGNLPYDVTSVLTANQDIQYFEVIQEAGDGIFVPSGWYHQVWNLADTISINHNWINGCNVEKMLNSILKSWANVKKEIADCCDMEDWELECQKILEATYGLDMIEFHTFLNLILDSRTTSNDCIRQSGSWTLGKNHIEFDNIVLKNTLNKLNTNLDFLKLLRD